MLSCLTWIESSVSFILLINLQKWHAGLNACVNRSSEFPPPASRGRNHTCLPIHACTQTTLACAGNDAAEGECGGGRGFEAWGWQLLALFIFDLTWPLRTRRLSDHRRTPLLRLSCAPVKRTAAPARGVVLSCFKGPLSGTKKLGLLVWNDTQRKTIENKAASQAFRWGWGQCECWFT